MKYHYSIHQFKMTLQATPLATLILNKRFFKKYIYKRFKKIRKSEVGKY